MFSFTDKKNELLKSTYLLTHSMEQSPFEKRTVFQPVKKFPVFYGTRRFITAVTSVRHLYLSWASPIQSTTPHPTFWRSILILSSHLCLGPPGGSFLQVSPPKPCMHLYFSPYALHAPPVSFSIWSPEQYWVRSTDLLSSSLCSFLHSPVTSLLLGPNILLNTLFSNTLSLRSYRRIDD